MKFKVGFPGTKKTLLWVEDFALDIHFQLCA